MINKDEFRKFAIKNQGIGSHVVDPYIQQFENMTRAVIEERPTNFREIDVFSRLIMDRIIFLGTQVDDQISNIIIAQLLFLESVDAKKDVLLYINSPGGSVTAGLGMYDTMQYIAPDVATICTGISASMGAVLLAGGAAGKRSALPHSRVMIHQPSGGMQGQSKDMEISYKLIMKMRDELYTILAKHSGKTFEDIERDSDRDFWLSAPEAKEYGLIDEVLERKTK
ncbi:MAG: ATP-dependent Clp protease proteolytic subunit [Cyclobacteriaceae bacterium]|nr:ATP-dependent Clp protease proteolytic subunit [Cyclobacteriaceae bacterium]